MVTRSMKMPSRAMVNLYDMSQEGLEDEGGKQANFTSLYDVQEHDTRGGGNGLPRGDKYECDSDGNDFGLASGIKSMAQGTKQSADNIARAGKYKHGSPIKARKSPTKKGNSELVVDMAQEMKGKPSASSGQGVGRKAFSSMSGYSQHKTATSKGGRLSFKDMADVATKANTLNVAVDAFKEAGHDGEAKRQALSMKLAGKAKLHKKASTLSVSGIDIESGVGMGTGSDLSPNGDTGLFMDLPT